jgi:hypothetical protein
MKAFARGRGSIAVEGHMPGISYPLIPGNEGDPGWLTPWARTRTADRG